MSTHAIGPGTCNLSINVRRPFHRALGRIAFSHDISLGRFARWALGIAASGEAARAEKADLKAIAMLRDAGRDGYSDADKPAIEAAIRLITQSANADHRISNSRAA